MYTKQMADENKVMLERARELLKEFMLISIEKPSTEFVPPIYAVIVGRLQSEYQNIDRARIKRRVVKAARELRNE